MNAAAKELGASKDGLLRVEFCGLALNSPIVLLSGCVGFGEEYTRVDGFSNRDVGAIVLKGTTGKARLGNKPHRVYETPSGMLNAIGLQNPGAEHVVRKILPTLDFSETRFFANVSGSTIEEYAPNIRQIIEHRQILTPLDLERRFGITGGNIFHGEMSLDQMFVMRPVAGWARYRTPVQSLYLCGSGAHPGGGVMGAPGYNCAREMLKR